jgi:hypothetical protein
VVELRLGRALLAGLAVSACEVPEPPPPTGGTELDPDACAGLVVVSSDYQSTSVAFLGWDGEVLSARVISSGSADAALSAPLSGDVVAPSAAPSGDEVVLVDRYPASVVTFLDRATGAPRRQLSVRTGFSANAQDYLDVAAGKAYVSRFEPNPDPGREPFDEGSDVLVVDPAAPAIVGRIDLGALLVQNDPDLLPRPSRLLAARGRVFALVATYSKDFSRSGDSALAVLEPGTDAVVGSVALPGLRGCAAMALSPDESRLAVACSGTFGGTSTPTLDDAGIAVVSLETSAVETVVPGGSLGAPPAFSVGFASDDVVVVPTFGREPAGDAPARGDELVAVTISSGAVAQLVATDAPFELGEVRCAAACGACGVADAQRGGVHLIEVGEGGAVVSIRLATIDDGIGLPPRYLGGL